MDCDRIFFALTSRPFPSGSPDDSLVECHLRECESCRQFAEALRPAELETHEALTPEERRKLPQYHPELSAVGKSSLAKSRSAMEIRLGSTPRTLRPKSDRMPQQPVNPWGRSDGAGRPRQLAEFSLSPPSRRSRLREITSLAALTAVVALGSWGLGWLAM